jgi:hypothetical protein
MRSSEMSVLKRPTRWQFPEDDILPSHRCENLKSYKLCIFCSFCQQRPHFKNRSSRTDMANEIYWRKVLFSGLCRGLKVSIQVALQLSHAVPQADCRWLRTGCDHKFGHAGFVVDKAALEQVSLHNSISTANPHSTKCTTFIYHPRLA